MTVPFTAVQFTTYEEMKKYLNPSETYSPTCHIISGGVAGALASAVTNPLDVCKTLLQTKGESNLPEVRAAKGLKDSFSIIKRMDGWKGFSRGMVPRLLVHAPSAAICWFVAAAHSHSTPQKFCSLTAPTDYPSTGSATNCSKSCSTQKRNSPTEQTHTHAPTPSSVHPINTFKTRMQRDFCS